MISSSQFSSKVLEMHELTWSRAEINQFANKEGLPAAMDGAVDGVVDRELSQFQK